MKIRILVIILVIALAAFSTFMITRNTKSNYRVDDLDCMVDIHLHLDGAISLDSAKKLAKIHNIDIPDTDEEILSLLRVDKDCKDLNEFLTKLSYPKAFLQTKEGITLAIKNLLNELKEQGVMYAEIRFAPVYSTKNGLSQDEVVQIALDALKVDGIETNLILCCIRGNDKHSQNIETINVAEKYLGKGVVAVDLAGAEGLYDTADYEDIFEIARDKNIPIIIHAGEAAGAESVDKALDFGAVRIGHGVRSLEDEEVVKRLVDNNIPLELCPTSNVLTAIYPSIDKWPLKELMDRGFYITINTDDPSVEGTTIKEEYQKLIDTYNLSKDDVKSFLINGVNASFASDDLKQKMLTKIESNFNN